MVKIAISGYYGFKNFGDEAILSVLVNHLKSLENTDITVFSSDVDYTKETYGVNAVKRFDIKEVVSTIKNCDQIFVMDKGRIIERGTHEELKRLGGKYSMLAKQQSLDKEE